MLNNNSKLCTYGVNLSSGSTVAILSGFHMDCITPTTRVNFLE